MTYIPYAKQDIDETDIEAVIEVMKSDYLTTGPKIKEFECEIADYVGVKYAVAISNGTAALHAACFAAGIGKGDEVIIPSITFAASANCVLYVGGIPVFADIESDTYNISPIDIEAKITPRTKAIIAVHFAGQPCEMDSINKIAQKYNLIVIEDAAHALGAHYKGKNIGSISDMTTFSFHPVKHITTGEGGMIVTNNESLYKRLLLFRSHGITRDKQLMGQYDGAWYYEQIDLGYNYRISDIQCALGISQLKRLNQFIEKRKLLVKRYNEAFKELKEITLPYCKEGCDSSWHLYVIKVENRNEIYEKLQSSGIGVNVHYIPVYKHPYYQKNGYKNVCCNIAEDFYEHAISLPLFPALTEEQQGHVIKIVKDVLDCKNIAIKVEKKVKNGKPYDE